MNCFVVPKAMLGVTGVTAMDTSVAAVTVSVAVPCLLVDGSAAVMIMPEATIVDVARPGVLGSKVTETSDEFHVTDVVRSCVELSEYVPLARN
jgi:hypothetical protein